MSAIETLDLARGTRAKLTAAAMGTSYPVWTLDGKGVVFRRYNVPFWVAADGSRQAGPVPSGMVRDYPTSAGPDADSVLVLRGQPETSADIFNVYQRQVPAQAAARDTGVRRRMVADDCR